MPPSVLRSAPQHTRGPLSRGLAMAAASTEKTATEDTPSSVDRLGGDKQAGIIRGYAVITRGEALGHDYWIDTEFVMQTASALRRQRSGVKSRFTHPGLSGDGMGKFLGRTKFAAVESDGEILRGDLHFSKTAQNTPDGDLSGYVMDLAADDPEAFGASIVFDHDYDAEKAFLLDNGAVEREDPIFGPYVDITEFKSPDPENRENLPHARLLKLWASDVVDDPAANPAGLFHRGQEIPAEADAAFAYALGLTNERPALSVFAGVDVDRARGFAARFLSSRGLTVAQKEGGVMSTAFATKKTDKKADDKPAAKPADAPEKTDGPAPDPTRKVADSEIAPAAKPVPATVDVPEVITEPGEKVTDEKGNQNEREPQPVNPTAPPIPVNPNAPVYPAPPTGGENLSAGTLKMFADQFGKEAGMAYLLEGLTYQEALGRSVKDQQKKIENLQTQLSAAQAALGEVQPLSGSVPADAEPATKPAGFSGMSPGMEKFRAGIKLPGKA